ncbi:MAG: CobD/CbiB family protein [Georgfuchsia sp.]
MTLFPTIAALVIEQYRPLPVQSWVVAPLTRFFSFLDRQLNDGQFRHGIVAWLFGVVAPALLLAIGYLFLAARYPLAGLLLAVATLYLTMGFRQFSHHFTNVQLALRAGELDHARALLAEWRGRSGDRLGSSEIARLAMEQALIASHRYVFAPLICFSLFGPGGALFYRLALFATEYWKDGPPETGTTRFGQFSQRAFHLIDWLPLRLTAIGFAVTGDFEDALFCWRTQSASWPEPAQGILLASGAGAMGVRLGLPVQDSAYGVEERPEIGLGEEADVDFMQSAIGLAWRTLVLFLLVMALVWIAGWIN